jgi:hypothetical protein
MDLFCEFSWCVHRHHHHHHHHRAPPSAPVLFSLSIVIQEPSMPTIAGTNTAIITITLTLPTTRNDGTALSLGEIASATLLRDSGSGPSPLGSPSIGPFSGPTVTITDASPATGTDTYSFFVTDTAGTQGDTSAPASVTVEGVTPLAPPAAGTLTAVSNAVTPPAPPAPPTVVSTVTNADGSVTTTFSDGTSSTTPAPTPPATST